MALIHSPNSILSENNLEADLFTIRNKKTRQKENFCRTILFVEESTSRNKTIEL